ncbi:MAG: hypothetical protein KatS3mg105_4057 [Gemmatales bacterium]|nr:MAG: hypothetical protein KatS3mg105_4057 [Gemmatales bacterium]
MFHGWNHRGGHYLLLIFTAGLLFMPNLGGPTLWDIDEGNNAEAAREMLRSANWRVPTFNYQLRVDKPALLYWFQILAYRLFGVGEFAARLPSALAGILTILLTYELGRLMFGPATGLLAGVVLASSILFCASAHFANPDMLLVCSIVAAFLFFWQGFTNERYAFVRVSLAMGLAVLAKGPVGLVLPAAIIVAFLYWVGKLRLLWKPGLVAGALAFAAVAAPWYIWVGVETKGAFLLQFWQKHNVNRFLGAMENHSGPVYYYFIILLVGLAPWSAFLAPTSWHAIRSIRPIGSAESAAEPFVAFRFLVCWFAMFFIFFTISQTKLPNYILPLYPAAAIMTARFLVRWQEDKTNTPAWLMPLCFGCVILSGILFIGGVLIVSGGWKLGILRGQTFPELTKWAVCGVIPIAGGILAWWLHGQHRQKALVVLSATAVVFLAPLAAGGGASLNRHKAPKYLAESILSAQREKEIRIGCLYYFQPSLVFYAQRQVQAFADPAAANEFLRLPRQVFLILPASTWERFEKRPDIRYRFVDRRRDMYRNMDVVLITNR